MKFVIDKRRQGVAGFLVALAPFIEQSGNFANLSHEKTISDQGLAVEKGDLCKLLPSRMIECPAPRCFSQ